MAAPGSAVTRVFAYGSNLSKGRMALRIPEAEAKANGRLEQHVLRFDTRSVKDGSGKANVLRTGNPEDDVWGTVYELTPEDLARLDEFEPSYDRELVEIATEEGPQQAWVYVAKPDRVFEDLQPFDWYKRHVVEGAREQGLPAQYVDWLDQIRAMPDPDKARAAEELAQTPLAPRP